MKKTVPHVTEIALIILSCRVTGRGRKRLDSRRQVGKGHEERDHKRGTTVNHQPFQEDVPSHRKSKSLQSLNNQGGNLTRRPRAGGGGWGRLSPPPFSVLTSFWVTKSRSFLLWGPFLRIQRNNPKHGEKKLYPQRCYLQHYL